MTWSAIEPGSRRDPRREGKREGPVADGDGESYCADRGGRCARAIGVVIAISNPKPNNSKRIPILSSIELNK